MPTMVTFRAGGAVGSALLAALVVPVGGCSREQQDWHAAQSAATPEAYEAFIDQHPYSELVRPAQIQIAQFAEERDWERASAAGTLTAYQQFLARYPSGRRAEDARIHIEAFSLGSAPRMARGETEISPLQGATGVKLLQFNAASAARESPPGASAALAQGNTPVSNTAATIRVASAAAAASVGSGSSGMPTADGYAVQLGAFGTEASANAEWARLRSRFGDEFHGLSPRIVSAGTVAGKLYRLQVPTNGEAQARAICSSLKQQWQACFAVPAETR
jgi:cell division septation protein DedD